MTKRLGVTALIDTPEFKNPVGVLWSAYAIEKNFLRPAKRAKEVGQYDPIGEPALLQEFTRIEEGKEATVLEFARRWGLFGHQKHEPWRPGSVAAITRGHAGPLPPHGQADWLPWIFAHVRGVRTALELRQRMAEGEPSLQEYLDSTIPLVQAEPAKGPQRRSRADHSHKAGKPVRLLVFGKGRYIFRGDVDRLQGTPKEIAKQVLAEILSTENLTDITTYAVVEDEQVRAGTRAESLIGAIYYHLAQTINGPYDQRLGRCEFCGALFLRTDPRQRFCPPPKTGPYATRASRCGAAFRAREQRKRGRQARHHG